MPYRWRLVRAASISGSLVSPRPRSAPRCCYVTRWLERPSSWRWPALRGRCARAAPSRAHEAVQTCLVLELEFPRGLAASAEPRHAALPAAASSLGARRCSTCCSWGLAWGVGWGHHARLEALSNCRTSPSPCWYGRLCVATAPGSVSD